MEKKYEENAAEQAGRNVYFSPFTPTVMGLIACAVPSWSTLYGKILLVIISLLTIRVVLGYLKQKHRDYSWHALTGVITYNLVGVFCLIPIWRVVGEPLWLLVLLVCGYVIIFYLSYRYRYIIIEGVFSARSRKTLFGKLYYILGFSLVALTGGGSYGFARSLQVFQGYDTATIILASGLVPFGVIIIVGFQGLWVRVENPNYDLNSEENPN